MGVSGLTRSPCDATWETVHSGRSLTLQIGTAKPVLLSGTSGKTLERIFQEYKDTRTAKGSRRSCWALCDYEVYAYDTSSLRVLVTKKKSSKRVSV